MIQINNNFSVLPFYDKLAQQHRFKPYAFGATYPLITPADTLLPFQLIREHREEIIEDFDILEAYYANRYIGYYLNMHGLQQAEMGFDVVKFYFPELNVHSVYMELNNANRRYSDAVIAIAEDINGNSTVFLGEDYHVGTWELPNNTLYLYVQIKATGSEGKILGTVKSLSPIRSIGIYNKDGVFVRDITQQMLEAGLKVFKSEYYEYDIIAFPAKTDMNLQLLSDTYYMLMSDGVQTWYSETFSVVQDISKYLKIEWWDNDNLVFDSGEIAYKHIINAYTNEVFDYKNTIYLCTDIGKPEYKFEEDGKERDGYFFAEKQLSEKVYKFTFVAPEFICDAVRFIRLSDNIRITKSDVEYIPDSFLAEVNWQEQGDLAAVDVEFRTNTVVKKIAAAWPK